MAPPRSNPRTTPKRSGKLTAVKNASDTQAILDKNSESQQLLLVCYASAKHAGYKGYRRFLLDLSAQPSLRNVAFVEVDLDLPALYEIGVGRGIQILPTVEAWKGGKCLESVQSGQPAKLLELLDRQFDKSKDATEGEGSTAQLAKAAIAAGAVCVLGFLVQRQYQRRNLKHDHLLIT